MLLIIKFHRFDDQKNHELNQHLLQNVQGILIKNDDHIDAVTINVSVQYFICSCNGYFYKVLFGLILSL